MDYRALTSLRDLLESYALAVQKAPNKPQTPPIPRELRHVTKILPATEVIRELEALPHNIIRPLIIRDLCESFALRHAVLDSSLFNEPKYKNHRNKRNWYRALGHVIDAWETLERDDAGVHASRSLRKLRKRVEDAVPRRKQDSLQLATLLVTADARLQKVERLQQEIDNAVALLGKNQLAYTHDGLQEVVESLWAQVRSEFAPLSQLVREGEKMEGSERDVVITRVESAIAELRARHTTLTGLAFRLPGLEVARGEGRERPEESDEDEWEDAWEDGFEEPSKGDDDERDNDIDDTGMARATAKPSAETDNIESFLKGSLGKNSRSDEIELPTVTTWGKGGEADKVNRLLLDKMEEKAALEVSGTGAGASFNGDSGHAQRRGGTRNRGSGKKGKSTARQRLSAALGIRKRKKKSLLD